MQTYQMIPIVHGENNRTLFSEELYQQDEIVISGFISKQVTLELCRQVIAIERDGGISQIPLLLQNCQATFTSVISLVDILQWTEKSISAAGFGIISGAALMLLTSATCGLRFLHSRAMIQLNASWFNGSDFKPEIADQYRYSTREEVVQYMARTVRSLSVTTIEHLLFSSVDTWLTAEEAVRMGFADCTFQ